MASYVFMKMLLKKDKKKYGLEKYISLDKIMYGMSNLLWIYAYISSSEIQDCLTLLFLNKIWLKNLKIGRDILDYIIYET